MLAEKPNPSLTVVKTAAAYFLLTLRPSQVGRNSALQCSYSGTLAVGLTNWNTQSLWQEEGGRLVMQWFLKLLLPSGVLFISQSHSYVTANFRVRNNPTVVEQGPESPGGMRAR